MTVSGVEDVAGLRVVVVKVPGDDVTDDVTACPGVVGAAVTVNCSGDPRMSSESVTGGVDPAEIEKKCSTLFHIFKAHSTVILNFKGNIEKKMVCLIKYRPKATALNLTWP